jgi:hypothetical protein
VSDSDAAPHDGSSRWKQKIPQVSFTASPSAASASGRGRRAHSSSKRKRASSVDEDSTGGDSPSIGGSSDTSNSESGDSSSSDSGSSSTASSSPSASSSDSSSHRRHSSHRRARRRKHRRRLRDATAEEVLQSSAVESDANHVSKGLRRFLKKLGVNTYRKAIAATLYKSIGDQTPVQWWRNATTGASAASDVRSVNEGLCLAMCLEAGNNAQFIREVVCRRLLGLLLVVRATGPERTAEWAHASALLPLNPLSSVDVTVQKMMDKEARRSWRSTVSYVRGSSSSSQRGRNPRFRRFDTRNGGRFSRANSDADTDGGYRSGSERPRGGAGSSSSRRGGGNGRRNGAASQSGAPSASSHRGSSAAGGSGANAQ